MSRFVELTLLLVLPLAILAAIVPPVPAPAPPVETVEIVHDNEATSTPPLTLKVVPAESAKVWENPCGVLPVEIFPEQVETYHLPWLVRIGYEKRGRLQYSCTGSLIDRQHILTAAHCVMPPKTPTRIQVRNCDEDKCLGSPRNYGVDKVTVHPEFNSLSTSFDHDIAVVRLDRDVNLATGLTRAVCLPVGEMESMGKPTFDSEFVVAGWRIHDNGTRYTPGNGPPRTIAVPPVPLDQCQAAYGDAIKLTPELQICAGGEGNEPCRGDAGAPLHAMQGRRVVQVGLASFGLPSCSNSSLPTVYTLVHPHMTWIQQTVAAA